MVKHINWETILTDKEMNTYEMVYLFKKHNITKAKVVWDNVLFYTNENEIILHSLEKEYIEDLVKNEIN